jgi:MFS family permease
MSKSENAHSKGWYWGVQENQLTATQAWVTFAVMFVFGFMSIYGLVRCGPVMPQVQERFGFTLANVGLVQTLYAMTGIILAFPGAWIMRNVGIKRTLVIACAVSTIGSGLGIVASSQFLLLASRLLEGIGAVFIMVIGPNVVTRIFPPAKQGLAMAVWSIWAPVGIFIAMLIIPYLYTGFGLGSLWAVSTIIYGLCLILLFPFFKLPKVNENEIAYEKSKGANQSQNKVTSGKPLVVSAFTMAISFIIWSFTFGGCVNTFYPTYLQEVKGASIYDASFLPSLISLFTMPLGILAGVLSDRIGTRKWFVTIPLILMGLLMGFLFWNEDSGMTSVMIFIGAMSVFSACIPMGLRASVPIYAKTPRLTDYALATQSFVTNIGSAAAPIFGMVVSAAGWQAGGMRVLMPACLFFGLATLFLCKNDYVSKKKRVKAASADSE